MNAPARADRTPVIIGVGQYSEAPNQAGYAALSPVKLAAAAVREAIRDTGATSDVAAAVDTLAAIRQFEVSWPGAQAPFGCANNLPRAIARQVGCDPQRAILEIAGGQGNQQLVGELGADIACGDSQLSIIAGSEAISTVLHLKALGESRDWSETLEGSLEDRGYGVDGLNDTTLERHGLASAIAVYALFDNARRARLGLTLDAYRLQIGRLFAPFSKIAAANPHAAARIERSALELATVSERNRIVGEPYTRMTVARDQVNQAAAVILCSIDKARELGVPRERWVHIHGVVGSHEPSPLLRSDLGASPAARAAVQHALDLAGKPMEAMDFIDLYSCFAIPVFNILDGFGLDPEDPRGFTLTGGLPFFGGAGNNYSMHAIAEAVTQLRARPGSWAFVGANGGFMSKYSAGVYSSTPASWGDTAARNQALRDAPTTLKVRDSVSGMGVVETYTIVPREKGDLGVVIARMPGDERCAAVAAPEDGATLAQLRAGMPFGQAIHITATPGSRNTFKFI